jgi:hypothetical protein
MKFYGDVLGFSETWRGSRSGTELSWINYDPDGTRVELMEPGTVDGQPAPSSAAPPSRHP